MERKCRGLVVAGPEGAVVVVVLRERVILRRVLGVRAVVRRRRESVRMEAMVRILRLGGISVLWCLLDDDGGVLGGGGEGSMTQCNWGGGVYRVILELPGCLIGSRLLWVLSY